MLSKRSLFAAPAARRRPLLVLMSLVGLPFTAQATGTGAMSTVDAFSGSVSSGNLILGTDGALYGVNYTVSASVTGGVIYRAAVDGSAIITLHQLDPTEGVSPRGGLLQASDGYLYGTTQYGGHTTLYTTGTIYRIAPDGANFSIIFRFDDYTSLNANSGPINVDGAYPQCELIEGSDGALYGVTTAGGPNGTGVVFRVSKDGTGYQVLHTFGAITSPAGVTPITNDDGATPTGALVDGKDGNLYGTASAGGENGRGVIFRLAYDGSNFAVIYEFSAANSSTNTGLLTNSDGVIPLAGLLDADDGFLYGVASQGGSIGYGTVFAVSRDGQVFNVLHSFGGADGSEPKAALLLGADGKLYGTTASGGTDSKGGSTLYGTIFSIGRDGAGFSSLWSMDGKNGITPLTKLVQISNTVFEGTNSTGGNCSAGTIYRLSLSGDTITGSTGCGYKRSTGAVDPGLVLLLGGLGLARRRRT